MDRLEVRGDDRARRRGWHTNRLLNRLHHAADAARDPFLGLGQRARLG